MEEQIRRVVLAGYDKSQPPEDLLLTYQIIYTHCPIPDSATGTLISEVHEIQVRLTSLSVQCYAWTEYNFTCVCDSVCVCVCVSVTLSVNSPTGQTPQRIFLQLIA